MFRNNNNNNNSENSRLLSPTSNDESSKQWYFLNNRASSTATVDREVEGLPEGTSEEEFAPRILEPLVSNTKACELCMEERGSRGEPLKYCIILLQSHSHS
jgi:hypothetical protein